MYICIFLYIPNPYARAEYRTRSFFKRRLTGLNCIPLPTFFAIARLLCQSTLLFSHCRSGKLYESSYIYIYIYINEEK